MESKGGPAEVNYHQPGLVVRGTDSLYVVQRNGSWLKFAELRKGKWKVLRFTQAMLDKALEQMKQEDDFRKRMDQERPMAKALAEMSGDVLHHEDFIRLTDEERVSVFGLEPLTEDEKEEMRKAMPATMSKVEVQRSIYRLYAAEEQKKAESKPQEPAA